MGIIWKDDRWKGRQTEGQNDSMPDNSIPHPLNFICKEKVFQCIPRKIRSP